RPTSPAGDTPVTVAGWTTIDTTPARGTRAAWATVALTQSTSASAAAATRRIGPPHRGRASRRSPLFTCHAVTKSSLPGPRRPGRRPTGRPRTLVQRQPSGPFIDDGQYRRETSDDYGKIVRIRILTTASWEPTQPVPTIQWAQRPSARPTGSEVVSTSLLCAI